MFCSTNRRSIVFGLAVMGVMAGSTCLAATDVWTNSSSGLWRVGAGNWSLNLPPTSADTAIITNSLSKTVTLDNSTPTVNRTVTALTLSAPPGTTNTLFLADIPTNNALQINSGHFTMDRGGTLILSNSAVRVIDIDFASQFRNFGGNITLDGGLIDFNDADLMRIGRWSTNNASLIIKNGTVTGYYLQLGYEYGTGTLSMSNGLIKLSTLYLGNSPTTNAVDGGTGIVSIANGELIVTNDVTEIGFRGVGQFIQSGGTSRLAYLSMGNAQGASGTLTISGGKLFVLSRNANDLARIGNLGTGQVNLNGGELFINAELILGDATDGSVLGTGRFFATAGQLTATNALTSIGKRGFGEMTISNATVTLTNVSVGRHKNAVGTLTIQQGAAFNCLGALSIGRLKEPTGTPSQGYVYMSGGLLSLANDDIWVGRGGNGVMAISNGTVEARSIFVGMSSIDTSTNIPSGSLTIAGGSTTLSSNLVVGTSLLSTGQVVMTSGTLTVSNTGGNAFLNVGQGSFNLSQGTINADNVYLTNTPGRFVFNGGVLKASNMAVANGSPFVVGNGSNPATLELQGGVFSFANGLVISPNATVTGCGTILGPITNNGNLATNCTSSKIIATKFIKSGSTASIYFNTANGLGYELQFKTNLSDLTWTVIPPTITGNGGTTNLTHLNSTNKTGFYRIRQQ